MQNAAKPLHIGLTGGIGSGKSTVAACLAEFGAALVDTDAIARRLTEAGGAAIQALRAAFGDAFINASGALDRNKMRELAFSDATAKKRLEHILHPLIGAETLAQGQRSAAAVVVFDVPLLVESGRWRRQVHRVWVVDCSESTQLTRVMQRSGWDADSVQAVLRRQASRAQRRAAADAVLHNDGISLGALREQVGWLWERHCL